jgi:hypothetical protein
MSKICSKKAGTAASRNLYALPRDPAILGAAELAQLKKRRDELAAIAGNRAQPAVCRAQAEARLADVQRQLEAHEDAVRRSTPDQQGEAAKLEEQGEAAKADAAAIDLRADIAELWELVKSLQAGVKELKVLTGNAKHVPRAASAPKYMAPVPYWSR